MKTRSQIKKLALAAEAKEKQAQKTDDKVMKNSVSAKVPKLDTDIMRIIRDKIEKEAISNLNEELPEAVIGNAQDKWNILVEYSEFGVLTDDLKMSNMEICILHLPIMYHERVYVNFGGKTSSGYSESMENLLNYRYIEHLENAIEWFNYVRLPDDISNFQHTRQLWLSRAGNIDEANELDDDVLLERQEKYIIEHSGERYLLARRFPAFAYEWFAKRNQKIYCRRIDGFERYIREHAPDVVEID